MRTRRLGSDPQLQQAAGNSTLLSSGSNGSGVAEVQDLLDSIGFSLPRSMKSGGPDGIFGPETTAAVQEFQRRNGLKADGVVGPKTLDVMEQTIEKNPFLEAPDAGQDLAAAQFDLFAPASRKRSVYT